MGDTPFERPNINTNPTQLSEAVKGAEAARDKVEELGKKTAGKKRARGAAAKAGPRPQTPPASAPRSSNVADRNQVIAKSIKDIKAVEQAGKYGNTDLPGLKDTHQGLRARWEILKKKAPSMNQSAFDKMARELHADTNKAMGKATTARKAKDFAEQQKGAKSRVGGRRPASRPPPPPPPPKPPPPKPLPPTEVSTLRGQRMPGPARRSSAPHPPRASDPSMRQSRARSARPRARCERAW